MFSRAAKLFATDVRYMNDRQELRFGAEMMRDRLMNAAEDENVAQQMRKAFRDLAPYFEPGEITRGGIRCFASCFCQYGDLLSQWRGYDASNGYAIGFDYRALARHSYAFHPGTLGVWAAAR